MASTGYAPLDSFAPAIFSSFQLNNYISIAFVMLLLYDHVITLDKEIEWIWTLRWRLPKVIFIVNRYIITTCLLIDFLPNFIYPLPLSLYVLHTCMACHEHADPRTSSCTWYNRLTVWVPILGFYPAQILMAIRICSLYGNSKILIGFLATLWLSTLIYSAVLFKLASNGWSTVFPYVNQGGCWLNSTSTINIAVPTRAVCLSIEGTFMFLIAYKIRPYQRRLNRTITVLARDSIAYFIIIFILQSLNLYSDINFNFPLALSGPAMCTTSIAVGRMMMNIRGLILDDPQHTVHLNSFQFAKGSESDSTAVMELDNVRNDNIASV
ncbi:hypothetical protein PILCRDRAFT_9833 [Piloderma croceum F 1598]|uniref:DUF6533 domain-containing protein n=1 Tax=Piloderma croceum (strain F 1598) TaxID=765440 RepID=A0A0C3B141_PILCF|nr:hypothetical protein PILCRDRAFT_9833 [Piloderma croceum F 1598]